MKENEAPEKIYIQPNAHDGWFETNNLNESFIEYTRTDALTNAFIEKAAEWLTKHAKKYYFNKERYLGTEELVEDFKLSMEM